MHLIWNCFFFTNRLHIPAPNRKCYDISDNTFERMNTLAFVTSISLIYVMTQISTNVQSITEVVALDPDALTLWAALHVPVYLDTPGMDSHVQVSKSVDCVLFR